jgi:hypothetical protein|tara:strand:+ start:273 stop:524 length:252 start_codon:yes stop_codon:yes gene_type:complete
MIEEGWDGLTPAEIAKPEPDDLDLLYAKVFKTSEGQQVLSHLRQITIEQPSWIPGEDASFGYVRTGMAEIVRMIEKRVGKTNE